MIETENLSRGYGGRVALHGLNLRVAAGEILGFLGPNGAGKSTTVKILTGMIKPDGGRASVAGFDVVSDPLEVKTRIGYVPESAALYESLSAREYLELIASLYHLPRENAAHRAGVFPFVLSLVYPNLPLTFGVLAFILAVTAAIEYALRLRVDEVVGDLEFRS